MDLYCKWLRIIRRPSPMSSLYWYFAKNSALKRKVTGYLTRKQRINVIKNSLDGKGHFLFTSQWSDIIRNRFSGVTFLRWHVLCHSKMSCIIFWVLIAVSGFLSNRIFLFAMFDVTVYPIFFIIFLYSAAISDFCAVKKKYGQYFIYLAQSTRKTRWRRHSVVQFLPAANQAHQDWFTGQPAFLLILRLKSFKTIYLPNLMYFSHYDNVHSLVHCLVEKKEKQSTFVFAWNIVKNWFMPLFIRRMFKAKSNRVVQHI